MADNHIMRFTDIKLTKYNAFVVYGIAAAASKNAGQRAVKYARDELAKGNHNDTGLLSHSIKSKVEATPLGPSVFIYSDVEYSRWVEDGTGVYGPYGTPIVPTTASVMRFQPGKRQGIGGKIDHRRSLQVVSTNMSPYVYTPTVQGQPAVKFMEKAMARLKVIDFFI